MSINCNWFYCSFLILFVLFCRRPDSGMEWNLPHWEDLRGDATNHRQSKWRNRTCSSAVSVHQYLIKWHQTEFAATKFNYHRRCIIPDFIHDFARTGLGEKPSVLFIVVFIIWSFWTFNSSKILLELLYKMLCLTELYFVTSQHELS